MAVQRFFYSVLFVFVSGVFTMTASANEAGKALFGSCIACHGADASGNPVMNAPGLTGLSKAYIARQLTHFKSGLRGADPKDTLGMQMRGMTAVLADEQAIDNVASYIAALPLTIAKTPAEGDLKNGNNRYQGNCGSCHGGKAEGNTALNAPRLAGLEKDYIIRQYNNFKQGIRGSHQEDRFGRQMKMMANSLPTEKDLLDVIAYIHAQGAAK